MKKLLIIGLVWPEPNSTAAGSRMLQLIELFQKKNYSITFACAASKTNNSFLLETLNIKTFEIQLNNKSFDDFSKKIDPNIVLFDRYLTEEQFGWRITENCPNAIKILDTEDLHFLRNARQLAYKNDTKISLKLLINDITKREIASIYRCDLTLIISKFELKLLKKTFKIPKSILEYTPFLLEKISEKTIKQYPSFKDRLHFITIGNFKHEPNWNAVLYLKSTIWPLIKKELPNAEMHIYGAYSSQKVQQLHNLKEGFLIKGWAENLENVFTNAKVCLAPLQFGAGLKGKLIDAMLFGTPSVTTKIGAEAMHKKLPWNGFICDTPKQFAQKSVELYTNQNTWETSQTNGIKIINTCYDNIKYGQKLIKRIEKIQSNLTSHRLNNFMGAIFEHHTLKSTKYMSKWIEEKNKKG
ncbi:glycosyltransferase [Lutibacter sp. HS1-25]|uniref:glycosyltransferase n=1 Tax=Lutibacter sp. HS1-25 TaxID=2485000 RepID=UPI0010123763|nr:glycosyltransferase [Lutibacter sp. HS1-25]RXP55791.1 glycosyltransferase [Lutibacter sp. HS1-25]